MTDENQKERLARMQQAQRETSARSAAVRRMLEADGAGIENKVAVVKTIQKTDRPRMLSAFNRLMNQTDDKTG